MGQRNNRGYSAMERTQRRTSASFSAAKPGLSEWLNIEGENHKGFFFKFYENKDTEWINQRPKDWGNIFGLFVDLLCSLHPRGSSPWGFQGLCIGSWRTQSGLLLCSDGLSDLANCSVPLQLGLFPISKNNGLNWMRTYLGEILIWCVTHLIKGMLMLNPANLL